MEGDVLVGKSQQ